MASPSNSAHFVNQQPIRPPFPEGIETAFFALGCFWGAERIFWQLPGVHTTAVGYAGGHVADATYAQVCGGASGHAETVLVAHDPRAISYEELLRVFWESHDPTQGMRQGNDVGEQYRSAIFAANDAHLAQARASREAYQERLRAAGCGEITTQITAPAPEFYYAEEEHQQYLAKHPGGYCGLGGTGVRF